MNNKLCKLILIFSTISVMGCSSKEDVNKKTWQNFSIISPTGAPSVVFYNWVNNENFQTNSDPANIIPLMVKETVDVVILPTNAGIQAIQNKNLNYKIAATITFGNVFVTSTGNDNDGVMSNDDYIVSFQPGAVPDKIFHYVYGNELDGAIHYVSNAEVAAGCLKTGKNSIDDNAKVDYVVLAEPAVTKVVSSTEGRTKYANLQELYKEKSGGLPIFQASLFVQNNLDKNEVNSFLIKLKNDIEAALETPMLLSQALNNNPSSEAIYMVKPDIATTVTLNNNGMGLGFALARENKDAIDLFLSLFGIGETSEEIYF